MKLSTVVKSNSTLKGKISQQIKKQNKTSTISGGATNVKVEGGGVTEESLRTQVVQKLSENNFISAPIIEKIKSSTVQNISAAGMNALIHQNDDVDPKLVDDGIIKGGYRVVSTIEQRDNIDCCYRKLGMMVMVVGSDLSFTEYVLTGETCSNEGWVPYQIDGNDVLVLEEDVVLTEDYSILAPEEQIKTQKDLNKVLKAILEDLINYTPSGDKNWVHDQFTPASTWVINHPLNKKVAVTVTDTAGTEVEGKITLNNGNKVTIEFNFPFSGEAVLN